MKKLVTFALSLSLALSLTACGGGAAPSEAPETTAPAAESAPAETPAAEAVELHVYAAASLTESLNQIAENYKAVAPNVTITYTFDSSGTLKTQIEEGGDCDLCLLYTSSASQGEALLNGKFPSSVSLCSTASPKGGLRPDQQQNWCKIRDWCFSAPFGTTLKTKSTQGAQRPTPGNKWARGAFAT